jgi:hypothetical protein
MSAPVATFGPEAEEGFDMDYEVQTALGDACNAAIDLDGEASHWLWVEIDGRICSVTSVTVDRDGEDTCEITIHAKSLA